MNKKILAASAIIIATGIVNSIGNKPVTPVLLGGYVLMLILAIMDAFGGQLSTLSGGIAMVAVIALLFSPTESPVYFLAKLGAKKSGG